jgi:hypothetical protein
MAPSRFSSAIPKCSTPSPSNAVASHYSGTAKLTINVMKSISENCPQVTIVQRPDLADYFLRVDHDGLVFTTKMAAFNHAGEMTFVGIAHSIGKEVKRFSGSLIVPGK